MTHLRLTIHNDDDLRKILEFLEKFDKKEVQIDATDTSMVADPAVNYLSKLDDDSNVDESEEYNPSPNDPVFLANKRYLEKIVERMDAGLSTYYTMEEFEQATDAVIAKYENKI